MIRLVKPVVMKVKLPAHPASFLFKPKQDTSPSRKGSPVFLAIGLLAIGIGLNSTQAQQPGYSPPIGSASQVRTYAPPVHIAPGSATALPPNRHRPRTTPGLELVKPPHEQPERIGLQDRIVQSISNARSNSQGNPASKSQRPDAYAKKQTVGSGLAQSRSNEPKTRQHDQRPSNLHTSQPFVVSKMGQLAQKNREYRQFGNSVVEPSSPSNFERFPSDVGPMEVQVAATQDRVLRTPPVRHAYVQDYVSHGQFDQELEWVEEAPQTQGFRPAQNQPRPAQQPTSVLRRHDDDSNSKNLQPQGTSTFQDLAGGIHQEIELLDQEAERRRNQTESPRSLLDFDDEELPLDGKQESKTSLLDRSCSEFQRDMLTKSIRDIALDISPPAINADRNSMAISRSWTDRNGQMVATGTMTDLRRGYVILDNGQKISFARLSDSDLVAVSEHWNIPRSCLFSTSGTASRHWHPQTFTWTASSLCHKPLYFENIQLERYGHSHGPFAQPVRSVAHFFVSLVTLPYHSAIHPANECEYPLGLYRPGDCAPWLKDPIPISLDGLRRQALVTGGIIAIVP